MAPPTVGKQVFLRVATVTTTVMRGMNSEDTTGQKAADGRKKSPAVAGKKTDAYCPYQRKEEDRQWPADAAFQAGRRNMGKMGDNLHESSCFCTGDCRTFSTAKGGLFVFADFQPADRQARMRVAANVRERALDDIADSHKRKGRSPEKPQIFLYLYHAASARRNRRRHFFLAIQTDYVYNYAFPYGRICKKI